MNWKCWHTSQRFIFPFPFATWLFSYLQCWNCTMSVIYSYHTYPSTEGKRGKRTNKWFLLSSTCIHNIHVHVATHRLADIEMKMNRFDLMGMICCFFVLFFQRSPISFALFSTEMAVIFAYLQLERLDEWMKLWEKMSVWNWNDANTILTVRLIHLVNEFLLIFWHIDFGLHHSQYQ